jgi:5-methylcytosine-specific restriction endonuclease McrA
MPNKDRSIRLKQQKAWYESHRDEQQARNKIQSDTARVFIRQAKVGKKCSACGFDDPICLDFHHVDPAEKDAIIAQAPTRGWSVARIQREMDKCVILCANCHRKEEYRLRLGSSTGRAIPS